MHDRLKNLVKEYLFERYAPRHLEGVSIIEVDQGFVTYQSLGSGQLYAIDVYVAPEVRGGTRFRQLLNKIKDIARETEHHTIITTCAASTPNMSHNVQCLLHCGFVITNVTQDGIAFSLEVN